MPVNPVRPRPIDAAARQLRNALGGLLAFLTVVSGVLQSLDSVDAAIPAPLQGVLATVPGWMGVLLILLYRIGIVNRTEPLVTPLEDPAVKTSDGRLVPLIPVTRDGQR
jgi:hypothetical protein